MISFSLNAASIDRAIREIKQYAAELNDQCALLRKKVAERIRWSASEGFRRAITSDVIGKVDGKNIISAEPVPNDVSVTVENNDTMSVVIANGSQAVFIEYGAGVYHNGPAGDSPHPWGLQQGFAIGAYPANSVPSKGVRAVWGYKSGKDIILTHGTPAAMPMYRGAEEAIRALDEIAREVFG